MDIFAIAAVTGMVTGVAGFVISVLNHRRVSRIKHVDHWYEATVDLNRARLLLDSLPNLLSDAKKSRERVLSATGRYQSGERQRFIQNHAEHLDEVNRLQAKLDEYDSATFDSKAIEQLARIRTEVLSLHGEADNICRYYRGQLANDEEARRRLHEERVHGAPKR